MEYKIAGMPEPGAERPGLSITPKLKKLARQAPPEVRSRISAGELPEFVRVQQFDKDLKLVNASFSAPPPPEKVAGQNVKEFSFRSRMRMAFTAKNCGVCFTSMLTLTYPKEYSSDGKEAKRHLNAMLTKMRQKYPGILYFWFLEFQKRGAPHFHVLLDKSLDEPLVRKIRRGKKRDYFTNVSQHEWASRAWFRTVDSGDEKHLRAGVAWEVVEAEDGGARYAAKYAAKMEQKNVPFEYENVGRFWGASRGVKAEMKSEKLVPTWKVLEHLNIDQLQFVAYDASCEYLEI